MLLWEKIESGLVSCGCDERVLDFSAETDAERWSVHSAFRELLKKVFLKLVMEGLGLVEDFSSASEAGLDLSMVIEILLVKDR